MSCHALLSSRTAYHGKCKDDQVPICHGKSLQVRIFKLKKKEKFNVFSYHPFLMNMQLLIIINNIGTISVYY